MAHIRLLDWLDSPKPERGLRELREEGWSFLSYPELASRVNGVAAQLADQGVETGDVVAIADADCTAFVSSFFGALFAGATPLPLPPPEILGDRYLQHLSAIIGAAQPAYLAAHGALEGWTA